MLKKKPLQWSGQCFYWLIFPTLGYWGGIGSREDFFSGLTFRSKAMTKHIELFNKPLSEEEMHEPMVGMEDNKAPWPDGYTTYFLKLVG